MVLVRKRKLLQNLKWVAELGVESIKLKGSDIYELIVKIANDLLGQTAFQSIQVTYRKDYFDKLLKKLSNTEIDVILVF